jgi:O-antigen/teichoic acid export membrane protein
MATNISKQSAATRLRGRLPSFGTLLENSVYGIATTAVNAAVGFLFWVVAARLYTAHAVGLATALLSATTLASTLSNLGIGSALVQRLPGKRLAREWSVTLNTSLILCIAAGVVASGVTIIVLPFVARGLSVVTSSLPYALMLGAGIVLWTLSTVMDFLFIAERKVKYAFARNVAFSLAKIGLLVVFSIVFGGSALALFGASVAGLLIAFGLAVQIGRHRLGQIWQPALKGFRDEAATMRWSLVGHHLINVGAYLPMYALPLVVAARLGVVQNAWAYIGWMVGSFALVVSPTVASSLFAEGSHDAAAFGRHVRRSFLIVAALGLPFIVVIVVFGHLILGSFGPQYATHSFALLVVLASSAIPDAVTNFYVVTLRVRRRLAEAAVLNLSMAALAVVLAWWLVRSTGVAGIAWAWLIAQSAGTVYAAARIGVGWLGRRKATLTPDGRP